MMKSRLKTVFYAEVLLNTLSAGLYLFGGTLGIELIGVSQPTPILADVFRWFAVMTLVINYVMARTLLSHEERALRFVLEGYLFGDVMYLVVLVQFVNTLGGVWAPGAVFAAIVPLFLASVRVIYLTLSPRVAQNAT